MTQFYLFVDQRVQHEKLEVDSKANSQMDFSNIVKTKATLQESKQTKTQEHLPQETSEDFVDDPDVPPLI